MRAFCQGAGFLTSCAQAVQPNSGRVTWNVFAAKSKGVEDRFGHFSGAVAVRKRGRSEKLCDAQKSALQRTKFGII
jgi:hypothetical protein